MDRQRPDFCAAPHFVGALPPWSSSERSILPAMAPGWASPAGHIKTLWPCRWHPAAPAHQSSAGASNPAPTPATAFTPCCSAQSAPLKPFSASSNCLGRGPRNRAGLPASRRPHIPRPWHRALSAQAARYQSHYIGLFFSI